MVEAHREYILTLDIFSLWTCSARPRSGDQETDLRRNSGWRRSGRDVSCNSSMELSSDIVTISEVLQGYDNPTMAYPYYNYGYGNYGHHGHM